MHFKIFAETLIY